MWGMKFKYTARTKTGELQTGFIDSPDRETATNTLGGHDLIILGIESAEAPKWLDRILNIFKKVRAADLMIFTRQFATLLDAKISLGDSLKNLHRQTRSPILKETISDILSDVEAGLSLSQALARHKTIFPDFYVNMVRSAEVTGKMGETMVFLADYLEKTHATMTKIRNSMIYPVAVVGLMIVVAGIMVGFVFPKLMPVFEESGVELPFLTQILFGLGDFVSSWWWVILIFLVVLVIAVVDYLKTKEGKVVFDELIMKLPVFGDLFRKLYIARFAHLTSVLIKGGTPIAQSLSVAGNTIGSIVYRDAILEVANAVREGQLLSNALQERSQYFPALVNQMVAVGESTGKLEELLTRVSDFYTREVDDTVDNLVELIQPMIMVVIGVAVGLMFAAVLLPMFKLMQTF